MNGYIPYQKFNKLASAVYAIPEKGSCLRCFTKMVVYYDGECGFCDSFVRLCLRNRRHDIDIYFSPLQGRTAQESLPAHLREDMTTVVVSVDGRRYVRSDAVVAVARNLTWPASWMQVIKVVPRPLRDLGYRFIARFRRWLPLPSACPLPTADERRFFLP